MSRKVVLSKRAEKKLASLFDFLTEKWSEKIKHDFIQKLDKRIEAIKNKPESFPESEIQKGLFKCVITKQTTLYYRFTSRQIQIVTIFDSRQNPEKLKKDL
ncbi:type II toxin-antitoxin system RelE/ParE family toxin [Adhaeribacter soli]|uniref:Type II toxin-antitoxin system RelE/ParE family toxin n=1 Tax=Adhaeribacter soli TaxID=2607655 RepID=A0A5N1IH05_9BACT|nr:type II toxin-antitoxin system RelE/ParE family toxin [Adhaeribacter soli]KAA9324935.1 type II toxin-antitoxin system RelE/ParE family toxin [Adhaeribacter soli]